MALKPLRGILTFDGTIATPSPLAASAIKVCGAGAFQNDRRSDIRIVTSGIEPAARSRTRGAGAERFIRKLTNIDGANPPKRMRWRDDGQDVSRIEQAAEEQLIAGRR